MSHLQSTNEQIAYHVRTILRLLGEDVNREGLQETPMRVAKAMREWFKGLNEEPPEVKVFVNEGADDLIIIRDIPFNSTCEHHLAPIIGTATVAYIPKRHYMGLSKAARVLDHFALRPQVQERLTNDVADYLLDALNPEGLMVMITAEHQCMSTRGVKKHGSTTTTTAVRGEINKAEVLQTLAIK